MGPRCRRVPGGLPGGGERLTGRQPFSLSVLSRRRGDRTSRGVTQGSLPRSEATLGKVSRRDGGGPGHNPRRCGPQATKPISYSAASLQSPGSSKNAARGGTEPRGARVGARNTSYAEQSEAAARVPSDNRNWSVRSLLSAVCCFGRVRVDVRKEQRWPSTR